MNTDSSPIAGQEGAALGRMPGKIRSLKRKVLVPLLVASAAVAALAIGAFYARSQRQLMENLRMRAELIAHSVNHAAANTSDSTEFQQLVSAINAEEDVNLIVVTGGSPPRVVASTRPSWVGKPLSETDDPGLLRGLLEVTSAGGARHEVNKARGVFDFRMPIVHRGGTAADGRSGAGAVMVHLATGPTMAHIRTSVAEFTVAFLAILAILTGLGYWLLVRHVITPVTALGNFIRQRSDGGSREWEKAATNDELGVLARTLRESLQRTDGALHDLKNYKAALDQHAIVSVIDLHGRLTHANDHLCSISKYGREELIGKCPRLLYSGHHPKEFFSDMWSMISSGNVWNGEICDRAKDGELYWTAATVVPLVGADGVARQFIAIGKEITERKVMEQELAHERDLLRTLLDNIPDQIYFKDLDSKFIRCGRSVARRFDLDSVDDLLGKCDFDFYADEHARPAFKDEQRIIRTGEPVLSRIEKEYWKGPGGIVTWALTTKMALRDASGNIIGTFGISKDITDIKKAEERVEEINRQLVETSRQAGMAEVATSVLHNVGNVLNSVNVSCSVIAANVRKSKIENVARAAALLRDHEKDLADFLTKDPAGAKLPQYLGQLAERLAAEQASVLEELKLLAANIDHIKEIVAMQQNYGKVSGVTETVPVPDLVEESLRIHASSFTRHELQPLRDYVPVPPITVEKHKAMQILVNLVRNAKHACNDSGRSDKHIIVRIRPSQNSVLISVIDNGVGIPAENLTKIFSHGFTTRSDGHGYGLHSSVLAAREMGGRLTAQSDGVGRGATFTLELPISKNLNPPANINGSRA